MVEGKSGELLGLGRRRGGGLLVLTTATDGLVRPVRPARVIECRECGYRMAETLATPKGSRLSCTRCGATLRHVTADAGSLNLLSNPREIARRVVAQDSEAVVASLIVVASWDDGWQRFADVEEKLGDLAATRGASRFYAKVTLRGTEIVDLDNQLRSYHLGVIRSSRRVRLRRVRG
jgi:hypothetical protein